MSQLISTVNQYLDLTKWINRDNLFSLYDEFTTRFANTTGKRITIGVAVFLLVTGHTIRRAITPPKHLKHLPYIPFFTFVNNFIIKKLNLKEMHALTSKVYTEKYNGYLQLDPQGWTYHTSDPVAIKQILLKGDIFPKSSLDSQRGTYVEQFTGSHNILFSSGHEWLKHRKIVNPAFHKSLPVKLFDESVQDLFDVWEENYPQNEFTLDVTKYFDRLTLQIIGKAGFGFDFNSIKDENSEWQIVYRNVLENLRNVFFLLFPKLEQNYLWLFPKRQREFKELHKWRGLLFQVIESKRKELKENKNQDLDESEKDLLTLMLESELSGEGILSNEELVGDIAVFFAGDHDTTSTATSAAFYYLAANPDIQEKARQEVISVLYPNGEIKEDISITIEDTKKFVYLNQIIKEVLRIHPPLVFLVSPRKVTQDVDLNGIFLPKGSLVNPNIYDTHHSSNVWHDPETFNPDRWSPNGEAEQLADKGMAWIPFSNGTRTCLGMNFSLLEQRVILAKFLIKYEWSLPKDSIHHDHLVALYSVLTTPVNLNIQFKIR
ncbi:cytochrome P-450 cyp509A1 [Cunninghamella echinulata]|nr:cytochrome P-450 cyp509A1 [Cunninghamella echinulata]